MSKLSKPKILLSVIIIIIFLAVIITISGPCDFGYVITGDYCESVLVVLHCAILGCP